jgi:hypothetical protein
LFAAAPGLSATVLWLPTYLGTKTKWIKQHLPITRFLGASGNAVKTQIRCAIATYVLIAIVKKECHLDSDRGSS